MQVIGKSEKFSAKRPAKNPYLHSPNHLLADELSRKLGDTRHFGFYLKMAGTYDHDFLRGLAGRIMESRDVKTPGKLFAYLIKKHNEEALNKPT